jgi:CRISPR/Cas system-associated exonuclease Cas4 (RecB family)
LNRIKKSIFLETLICPRKGWLLRNGHGSTKFSLGEQFRLEQGIEIGQKARELFPTGYLVQEKSLELSAETTVRLLADPSVNVIFEATFLYKDYVAKADVLIRNETSWDLVEVKSKTSKATEKKPDLSELTDDMAYTSMIIGCMGLNFSNIRLMLISDQYRLGMSLNKMFKDYNYTENVVKRMKEFEKFLETYSEISSQPTPPETKFVTECRKCEFFEDCILKEKKYNIFDIPRLSPKQLQELNRLGVFYVIDIPTHFALTDMQKKPVSCMQSGKVIVDGDLKKGLAKIIWPAHYLDFETTQTAIPLYPGILPYEKIPTQYSIHTCTNYGEILYHKEDFADPQQDCRRELAESLIKDLDGEGSILIYSPFEKQIINGLIKTFPDLSAPLNSILNRFEDLLNCSKAVNHPEFKGSNSIKDVLPVLVPEMSYDGLPIADGEDALVTFAYMARGAYSPEECAVKRREMLQYCEQDTFAMVKIHEVFQKISE